MNTTGIIEHQTARTIVENVTQARTEIQQAFILLQGAKDRLKHVLGDGVTNHYGHLWEGQVSDWDLPGVAKKTDTFIERNAWRYILKQTGMTAFMTERREKELRAQLEKGDFPPLTVENILSSLQGLVNQVGSLLQESVQEVFQWLRPGEHSAVGQLKTNKHFRVGHKVIVNGVESDWNGHFRLNSYREANFRALGNVFSLLDGQGAQQYPDDLVTQLNMGLKQANSGNEVATPYLTCKPHKNGHAHLRFLRIDLLDRLNQIGSDGSLPREAA